MAIAGLIIGLLGLICGFVGFGVPICAVLGFPLALVGLILSAVGMKKNKNGVAIAGLVISIIATVFTAVTFFTCGICVLCVNSAVSTIV